MTMWTEFAIEELGFEIIKPKVYHRREIIECENGIEYVTRSKYNNGVTGIVERPKKDVANPKGVISFGAENASFFYRTEEWISGRDMYYIDTRSLSQDECMFLITCLQTIVSRYPYNFGLFPELLKKETIKLPAKKDKPDFKYMEKIIKSLKPKVMAKINVLGSLL